MELLSICIPTYKRNLELLDSLEEMLEFLKKFNISVYINDNDKDSELEKNIRLKNIIQQHKKIFYKKNNPSLTIDENMLDVLARANSKYCLWLGDDDFIFKEDLEKLYLLLENNEYDLVILNKTEVTKDELLKLKRKEKIKLKYFNEKKFGEYSDLKFFIEKNYNNFRYGNIIVKREYLDKVDILKYYGTYHCYGGYIYESLFFANELHKKISVNVVDALVVYMLKIERSWEEVKWEALIGEVNMYFNLPDNNYKKIIINSYYGNRNIILNKHIVARQNKELKLKLKEIEKYFTLSNKMKSYILNIFIEIYICIKILFKKVKNEKF